MSKTGQLFPEFVECHFFTDYRCGKCGSKYNLNTRHPRLSRDGTDVVLNYPMDCNCGHVGLHVVRMPMLLFGYIFVTFEVLRSEKRWGKEGTKKPVAPRHSSFFETVRGQFHRLLEGMGVDPAPRSPHEATRLSFGMSPENWAEFLKRLGMDEESRRES